MKVVGYARLSPRPEEKLGIEVQISKMKKYCELYDLELVAIKREPGLVSGKNLDRPVLQEALAMLKNGEAEGLLVAKLDRLSRRVVDMGYLIEEYFAKNYELFSVAESVDTRTASGRMVLNLLTTIAQWEREVISERTSEALQYLIAQGVHVGRPGFGYEHSDEVDEHGRRIIKPVARELETLDVMVHLRSIGHTLREVATLLNLGGHKTKRDGEWHAATVGKILKRIMEKGGAA